jgi:hypothetical protein
MDQRTRKYMAKLGRKGGKVRSERLTSSRRQELARLAANTRWSKYKLAAKVDAATAEDVEKATALFRSVVTGGTGAWSPADIDRMFLDCLDRDGSVTGGPVVSPVRVGVPAGESSEVEGW